MPIPRLVKHKEHKKDETAFTSCPRDDCDGTVEKSESIPAKLNITSAVWICRSCDACWKPVEDKGEFVLSYVGASCSESDAPVDEKYHAYK